MRVASLRTLQGTLRDIFKKTSGAPSQTPRRPPCSKAPFALLCQAHYDAPFEVGGFTGKAPRFTGEVGEFTGEARGCTGKPRGFTREARGITGKTRGFLREPQGCTGEARGFSGNSREFPRKAREVPGEPRGFTWETRGFTGEARGFSLERAERTRIRTDTGQGDARRCLGTVAQARGSRERVQAWARLKDVDAQMVTPLCSVCAKRSYADLNRDRGIQSPECQPLHHRTRCVFSRCSWSEPDTDTCFSKAETSEPQLLDNLGLAQRWPSNPSKIFVTIWSRISVSE